MTIRDRSLKAASCHNLSDHARQCCVMALPEAGAHTRREKRRSCWWYRSDQRMITAGSMGDFQSEGFQKFGLSWHWPWKWVGAMPLVCLVTYVWDHCRGNLDSTLRQRELIFDNVPPSCANIVLTQRHHLLSPALSWFLLSGGHLWIPLVTLPSFVELPSTSWTIAYVGCHNIVTAIASFQIPQKR